MSAALSPEVYKNDSRNSSTGVNEKTLRQLVFFKVTLLHKPFPWINIPAVREGWRSEVKSGWNLWLVNQGQ